MTAAEQVKELICKVKKGKLSPDEVTPDARLIDDLKFDSLGLMELLVDTEELFKVQFSHEEAHSVKTVGQMVAFVDTHLKAV